MDSYIEPEFHNDQEGEEIHNQFNSGSGLLRSFRSAPSSLFNGYPENSNDSEKSNGELGDKFWEYYERKPKRLNSKNGYSGSGQLPPQYPKQNLVGTLSSMQRSNWLEKDQSARQENGGLNLSHQISSLNGIVNHLNPQNGYTNTRDIWNYKVDNGSNGESSPSTSRLSMSHLPQIPENVKETRQGDRKHEKDGGFELIFASSWNDSRSNDASHLSKNGELGSRSNVLSHHLSLPKTSTEMVAVEKLLNFQDTVPWKIRAKRGCATHPRSIAERIRRNRISERIKKLQELVPKMDEQTNTADMLDLAAEYIKGLQNQYKVLSNNQAKCKCLNLQHSVAK